MRKILPPLLLCSILLLVLGLPARAQGTAYADLAAPDLTAFPSVSALLDVYDTQGQFVSGLKPEGVTVLEDNQPRPAEALNEIQPPAQLVVTVNPGPPMAVRDAAGVARYSRVSEALRLWAEARPADSSDDLSLVATVGPLLAHDTTANWLVSFNAYQPDARAASPSLQSLAFAMDLTDDPLPNPSTKRAILFITPHLDATAMPPLESLAMRALQSKVRIFVWLIDSEAYFNHDSATALKSLAFQTGGRFFTFAEAEAFPDVETYLAPLRRAYTLKYTSKLTGPGSHTLSVQVQTSEGLLTSPALTFNLDIQPPNPILLSPPLQIVRQTPPDKPFDVKALAPVQQPVEMIVEFPDGHPRALARSALYVDGQQIDENSAEPFNKFVWDLSGYTTSGQHELKVEVLDSLGLSKMSMGVPVTVTVVRLPSGAMATLARNTVIITIGAILLAGAVLFIILFTGGKLRLPSLAALRRARKRYEDPLTQPVPIPQESTVEARRPSARLETVENSR